MQAPPGFPAPVGFPDPIPVPQTKQQPCQAEGSPVLNGKQDHFPHPQERSDDEFDHVVIQVRGQVRHAASHEPIEEFHAPSSSSPITESPVSRVAFIFRNVRSPSTTDGTVRVRGCASSSPRIRPLVLG